MIININISAESAEDLRAAVLALAPLALAKATALPVGTDPSKLPEAAPDTTGIDATEAPKRTRRTKAQIEADEKAAAAPAISATPEDRQDPAAPAEPEPDVFGLGEEPASVLTKLRTPEEMKAYLKDTVMPVFQAYINKHGHAAAVKVINDAGFAKIGDVTPDKIEAVLATAKAGL